MCRMTAGREGGKGKPIAHAARTTHGIAAGMDVTCLPAYSRLRVACSEVSAVFHSGQIWLPHAGAAFKCNDGTEKELVLVCHSRLNTKQLEMKMTVVVLPGGCRTYGCDCIFEPERFENVRCDQLWTLRRYGSGIHYYAITPDELIRTIAVRFPVCSLLSFGLCFADGFEAEESLRWEVVKRVLPEPPEWDLDCE